MNTSRVLREGSNIVCLVQELCEAELEIGITNNSIEECLLGLHKFLVIHDNMSCDPEPTYPCLGFGGGLQ